MAYKTFEEFCSDLDKEIEKKNFSTLSNEERVIILNKIENSLPIEWLELCRNYYHFLIITYENFLQEVVKPKRNIGYHQDILKRFYERYKLQSKETSPDLLNFNWRTETFWKDVIRDVSPEGIYKAIEEEKNETVFKIKSKYVEHVLFEMILVNMMIIENKEKDPFLNKFFDRRFLWDEYCKKTSKKSNKEPVNILQNRIKESIEGDDYKNIEDADKKNALSREPIISRTTAILYTGRKKLIKLFQKIHHTLEGFAKGDFDSMSSSCREASILLNCYSFNYSSGTQLSLNKNFVSFDEFKAFINSQLAKDELIPTVLEDQVNTMLASSISFVPLKRIVIDYVLNPEQKMEFEIFEVVKKKVYEKINKELLFCTFPYSILHFIQLQDRIKNNSSPMREFTSIMPLVLSKAEESIRIKETILADEDERIIEYIAEKVLKKIGEDTFAFLKYLVPIQRKCAPKSHDRTKIESRKKKSTDNKKNYGTKKEQILIHDNRFYPSKKEVRNRILKLVRLWIGGAKNCDYQLNDQALQMIYYASSLCIYEYVFKCKIEVGEKERLRLLDELKKKSILKKQYDILKKYHEYFFNEFQNDILNFREYYRVAA